MLRLASAASLAVTAGISDGPVLQMAHSSQTSSTSFTSLAEVETANAHLKKNARHQRLCQDHAYAYCDTVDNADQSQGLWGQTRKQVVHLPCLTMSYYRCTQGCVSVAHTTTHCCTPSQRNPKQHMRMFAQKPPRKNKEIYYKFMLAAATTTAAG